MRTVVAVLLLIASSCVLADCGLITWQARPTLENPMVQNVLPKLPNTTVSSCGGNCTYTKGFSCVQTPPVGYSFVECESEQYPKCLGTIGVANNCKTLECCQELNKQTLPKVNIFFNSFNYVMKFRNEFGYEIPCEEFESNTNDNCVQFADYAASSDPRSCYVLRDFFNSVDDMTFELF